MTTNSQLSTTEPKQQQQKYKLSKQLEQEQNHRNVDHMEGQQGAGRGRMGQKVQGMRNIIGRYETGGG